MPEPRYRQGRDEYEKEFGEGRDTERFLKPESGEGARESATRGFGMRRSREPFEKRKEEEAEEESLRQPEYGRTPRRKRAAKRK